MIGTGDIFAATIADVKIASCPNTNMPMNTGGDISFGIKASANSFGSEPLAIMMPASAAPTTACETTLKNNAVTAVKNTVHTRGLAAD